MTDDTMIRTATPSEMPKTDAIETNEANRFLRFVRKYRRAIKAASGRITMQCTFLSLVRGSFYAQSPHDFIDVVFDPLHRPQRFVSFTARAVAAPHLIVVWEHIFGREGGTN
jgi:hypothetical protein